MSIMKNPWLRHFIEQNVTLVPKAFGGTPMVDIKMKKLMLAGDSTDTENLVAANGLNSAAVKFFCLGMPQCSCPRAGFQTDHGIYPVSSAKLARRLCSSVVGDDHRIAATAARAAARAKAGSRSRSGCTSCGSVTFEKPLASA